MSRLLPQHAALLTALLIVFTVLAIPVPARAAIAPATAAAGPANDIIAVDGAALAPDGTGGILYSAVDGGVTHLFVIPVDGGRYSEPIQVDTADPYGATQPSIAAGDGGRLMVVWVQPFATASNGITDYELNSAEMEPGAHGFAPAIQVDTNVSEPYTSDINGVDPDVSMEPDGQTYVVYRAIEDDCGQFDSASNPFNGECGIGTLGAAASSEVIAVRVAESTGGAWSSLGELNQAPQLADPDPAASNAPQISSSAQGPGNAVVVWQEPDSSGYARIWTRWIYGTTLGNPIQISPTTWNGQLVSVDADAPAVSLVGGGQAAFRLAGGPGSPLATPQLFLAAVPSIADTTSSNSSLTDVTGGASVGQPSVANSAQDSYNYQQGTSAGDGRVADTISGNVVLASNASGNTTPVSLGPAAGQQAFLTANPYGGGLTAWQAVAANGGPAVAVLEADGDGRSQSAQLAGAAPGPDTGLTLGSDYIGDALLAWMQGSPGDAEVMSDFIPVPPQQFKLSAPSGWLRPAQARISWDPAADATTVTYAIDVDGRQRIAHIAGPTATSPTLNLGSGAGSTGEGRELSHKLGTLHLTTGVHHVTVIATDAYGGQISVSHTLRLDATPPIVKVTQIDHRHGVHVTIKDRDSGVALGKLRIGFGDGISIRRHATVKHTYSRRGRYTITATVQDHVGNRATVHLRVTAQ